MRLHRNLAEAVVQALEQIFSGKAYADRAVASTLKSNKRWGSRDRAFIAETIYDIVRWKRLYSEAIGTKTPLSKQDLFGLLFVSLRTKDYDKPDWPEFQDLSLEDINHRITELSEIRCIRESIPDWLDKLGVAELGESMWTLEIAALNEQAKVVLRTNTLKTSRSELQSMLEGENIKTLVLEYYPEALELQQRQNVAGTRAFKQGYFEIQDASSQRVAHFTGVVPGMTVLDACAGAGGKSLHMAGLMNNEGQILALDVEGKKLRELHNRAGRNGVSIIRTRLIKSSEDLGSLDAQADIVLIDAPCSGLGVLRRNPDAKWKLSKAFIDNCIITQRKVLADYSKMVKPDGRLIYATCSILPMENQEQVKWFLNTEMGKDFTLEDEEKIWASRSGYDGFYMARLLNSK